MIQDTIQHHNVSTEIPGAKASDESLSESHIVDGGGHAAGDSVTSEIQQSQVSKPTAAVEESIWEGDSSVMALTPFQRPDDSISSLQNIFQKKKLYGSDKPTGRYGMSGDPMPYNIRSDNAVASVIIIATLISLYSIMRARRFFHFQLKNFFRTMRGDSSLAREAASDTRNLVFIILYGVIVFSLVFFFYTKEYIATTYITYSEYTLMSIYLGEIIAYVFAEIFLERFINNIFFPKVACDQWMTSKLLIYACGGVAVTPLLLLMAFFGLQTDNSVFYALIVLGIVKILSFYKTFSIFFKKIGNFLQFFLYLCTLEIIPTLLIWVILLLTANYLKVDY